MTEYRFARVLADFASKHGFSELERVVKKANRIPETDKAPLDRRRLTMLAEGDPRVKMTLEQFQALDRWLEPQGQGLAFNSLFERSNVLQTIADACQKVTFLPGSKPNEQSRVNLDHWDVRALARVQRDVNRFGPLVQFDIRDVFLHDKLDDARESVHSGGWKSLLANNGPSLAVPGSGRATHACELLFARMFSTEPLIDEQDKSRVPFHFVWPENEHHVFPSAFRYTQQELDELYPKQARALRKSGGAALEIGGNLHVDLVKQGTGRETFGVAVAQRRPGGQIWLVLAGITGPATYGVARVMDGVPFDLQSPGEGKCSPVFWTLVRTRVKKDPSRRAHDMLKVEDSRTVGAPQMWVNA